MSVRIGSGKSEVRENITRCVIIHNAEEKLCDGTGVERSKE